MVPLVLLAIGLTSSQGSGFVTAWVGFRAQAHHVENEMALGEGALSARGQVRQRVTWELKGG